MTMRSYARLMLAVLVVAWQAVLLVSSFAPSAATGIGRGTRTQRESLVPPASVSSLAMAPRFDPKEQKWFPSSEEESAEANYGPVRSLLRHGPKAFFVRVTQPDQYDQAVLKFMASDAVGRWEAQGNMDRFNENAQDWIFERLEAKRKGKASPDYVTLNPKQVVLSSVWAGIVFWFANDVFQRYVLH